MQAKKDKRSTSSHLKNLLVAAEASFDARDDEWRETEEGVVDAEHAGATGMGIGVGVAYDTFQDMSVESY